MTNDTDAVLKLILRGKELYDEIKRQPTSSGLPSVYTNDFLACLLLALLDQYSSATVLIRQAEDSSIPTGAVSSSDLRICIAEAQKAIIEEMRKHAVGELPVQQLESYTNALEQARERLAALATEIVEKTARLEQSMLVLQQAASHPVEAEVAKVETKSDCVHVDDQGKCTICTEEETVECPICDDSMILSKAHKCKNFDDCGRAYCEEHKDELSEYGYCDDCRILTCDGCNEEIEAGTEHRCSDPKCNEDEVFCNECAKRYLGEDGNCTACAGVEEDECSGCGNEYIETRLTRCKGEDCENSYCPECRDDQLEEDGLCPDCAA